MAFNIHELDNIDYNDEGGEEAFYEYQDRLLNLFIQSPEGQVNQETSPETGLWAAQFMYYGYGYIGVAPPQISPIHAEEIITELFPRKISLTSPEEARDALPELIAFWEYLKREYRLRNATKVLAYLRAVDPQDFEHAMFDPANFGMAKSFVMMGQQAGFDMTDEKEMNTFMNIYNTRLIAETEGSDLFREPSVGKSKRVDAAKEKRKRKAAKAARKRNRKKR
jgi:hypothetical protein